MKRLDWTLSVALGLASLVACGSPGMSHRGNGGDAGAGGDTGASGAAGSTGAPSGFTAACAAPKPGSPLLRLMNRAEFERTLSDVFPTVKGQWTNLLPADTVSSFGFDNDASASVGNQQASAIFDTAISIANAVTGTALANLLPCSASTPDRSCAEQFLARYARRLFRRALTGAEHDRYLGFFDQALAKSDFKTALKWTTVGLIQSPNALYRSEIGSVSGGARQLSPQEVATELAYTYTGSTPSEDLLTRADAGTLGDPVAVAKDLLATPAGKQVMQHFFEGYLAYSRVPSIQKPNITAFSTLSNDMVGETKAFIDSVVLQQGGGLKELLTAPSTNPSQALAQYYGFPAPAADYAPVARPAGYGVGILAQGAFLASHANSDASSPTQRGLFTYLRLFCNDRPTPPPNVPPISSPQPGVRTTRQRYEEQHALGNCGFCHQRFDPLGFAFEHFDEGGRYRDTESGLPIDASGSVSDPSGTTLTFSDEEGLMNALAAEPLIYQCFAGYLSTYAFGTAEACIGASQVAGMQEGSVGIADAFADLAAEPHFSQRSLQ